MKVLTLKILGTLQKITMYLISKAPENAPDEAEYVTINFEKGIPVAVNGENLLLLHFLKN